jgi:hypothetical protein
MLKQNEKGIEDVMQMVYNVKTALQEQMQDLRMSWEKSEAALKAAEGQFF